MVPNTLTDSSALVFTVSEVATILQLPRGKVYLLIQEGILDSVKIGFEWRVRRASLERIGGIEVKS